MKIYILNESKTKCWYTNTQSNWTKPPLQSIILKTKRRVNPPRMQIKCDSLF